MHCVWDWYPLFCLHYRSSYNHCRNHCSRLNQIQHVALVSSNIHHLAPHSEQACRFFIQDICLGTVLVNEAIFKSNLKNSNDQLAQALSLINLTWKELKDRLWRHGSFACDSRCRTHILRPFSETFRISKNEDFNGPYLENENEVLKNSFETVFRA